MIHLLKSLKIFPVKIYIVAPKVQDPKLCNCIEFICMSEAKPKQIIIFYKSLISTNYRTEIVCLHLI